MKTQFIKRVKPAPAVSIRTGRGRYRVQSQRRDTKHPNIWYDVADGQGEPARFVALDLASKFTHAMLETSPKMRFRAVQVELEV